MGGLSGSSWAAVVRETYLLRKRGGGGGGEEKEGGEVEGSGIQEEHEHYLPL